MQADLKQRYTKNISQIYNNILDKEICLRDTYNNKKSHLKLRFAYNNNFIYYHDITTGTVTLLPFSEGSRILIIFFCLSITWFKLLLR